MNKIPELTPEQTLRLIQIDQSGEILPSDRDLLPGIHFCPEWDELPVCDLSAEASACTCAYHDRYPQRGNKE